VKLLFSYKNIGYFYYSAVFILSLILGFLLTPGTVLDSETDLLAFTFIILFALTSVCTAKNLKERVVLAKQAKNSAISTFSSILGITALQACGLTSFACGTSIATSLFLTIVPGTLLHTLQKYGPVLLIITIIIQILSLYYMRCFKVDLSKKLVKIVE
jgi:hypothetical protein